VDHRITPSPLGVASLLKSLAASFGDLPALLWQLDIRKNELTFFNESSAVLGERIPLILKNPALAREALLAEDRDRFFRCFEKIRAAQAGAAVVRVRESDGLVRWILLMGRPEPGVTSRCIGLIAELSGLADLVLGPAWDAGVNEKIELFDNPVLLFDFRHKRVVNANNAARAFLGDRLADRAGLPFEDLLSTEVATTSSDIFEGLIFANQWSGTLLVTDGRAQARECAARVRSFSHHDEHLLWVSLVPTLADDQQVNEDDPFEHAVPAAIAAAFEAAASIKALLDAFLDHQPAGVRVDGVLRSRIFGSENRVVVTGAGAPFLSMPSPETFPYEGSIAENIARFGLDHLIVEDTSRSIKPIDWVLFIPKGIKSYFAKPFFERGVLKNVFIACSTDVGRFTERNVRGYTPLLGSLEQAFNRLEDRR
jgi:hypothetical protein